MKEVCFVLCLFCGFDFFRLYYVNKEVIFLFFLSIAFVTIEKIAQVLWWGAKRSVQHRGFFYFYQYFLFIFLFLLQKIVKIDTVLIQNGFWLTCCQFVPLSSFLISLSSPLFPFPLPPSLLTPIPRVVVQAEKEQKNTKLFLDFFLFLLVREKTLADFAFRAHRKHPLFEVC